MTLANSTANTNTVATANNAANTTLDTITICATITTESKYKYNIYTKILWLFLLLYKLGMYFKGAQPTQHKQ